MTSADFCDLGAEFEEDETLSSTVKTALRAIADHLPDSATFEDAMHELYVHMKVAKGKQAAEEGRVVSQELFSERSRPVNRRTNR